MSQAKDTFKLRVLYHKPASWPLGYAATAYLNRHRQTLNPWNLVWFDDLRRFTLLFLSS